MKGPGLRYRYDVLRVWQCPVTKKFLKTPVWVTAQISPFCAEKKFMKLVEPRRKPSVNVPVENMYSSEFVEPFPMSEPKPKQLPAGKRYLVPKEDVVKEENNKAGVVQNLESTEVAEKQGSPVDENDFENGIFDGPFERPSEA